VNQPIPHGRSEIKGNKQMAHKKRILTSLLSAGILISGVLLTPAVSLAEEACAHSGDGTQIATNSLGACWQTADKKLEACGEESPDSDDDGVRNELDQCPGTPPRHAVDASGCSVDADGDGVSDHKDECPRTRRGVRVDGRGCDLDLDGDGVPYYRDRCQSTPPGVEVDDEGCTVKVVLGDVLFQFNRSDLTKAAQRFLDELAISLIKRDDVERIRIFGHTDSIGSRAYNQRLSKARATSVMRYLKGKGVTLPMSVAGHGETKPAGSNKTPAGRQRNRRVEIELELFVP
jgi:OOP family OmpA-OmpF porin